MFRNKSYVKADLLNICLPGYKNQIYLRSHSSDLEVFEAVFISHRFNTNEIRSPRLIIDAGANIGLVSVYFANKYPEAEIYSIEPEESNYDLLVKNTSLFSNIHPFKAAIWKNHSQLFLENPNDEKWSFRIDEENHMDQSPINSLTVKDILKLSRNDFIDIFKIDIEGSERELFEENYAFWIDKVGMFIIELHDRLRGGCKQSFYKAIDNLCSGPIKLDTF